MIYEVNGESKMIYNDYVFVMIGYYFDYEFLKFVGI